MNYMQEIICHDIVVVAVVSVVTLSHTIYTRKRFNNEMNSESGTAQEQLLDSML